MTTKQTNEIQVPSEEEVNTLIGQVAAIAERIDAFAVPLTSAERRTRVKMRTGGAQIVSLVGQVANGHGLAMPDVNVEQMNTNVLLSQRLQPLTSSVQQLERRLSDTMLAANGDAWNAATAMYTALSRIANNNAAIEVALKPVVAFFARRGRKATPATSTPETPPVTPPLKSVG